MLSARIPGRACRPTGSTRRITSRISHETAAKAARRGLWRGEFVEPSRWRRGERLEAAGWRRAER